MQKQTHSYPPPSLDFKWATYLLDKVPVRQNYNRQMRSNKDILVQDDDDDDDDGAHQSEIELWSCFSNTWRDYFAQWLAFFLFRFCVSSIFVRFMFFFYLTLPAQ